MTLLADLKAAATADLAKASAQVNSYVIGLETRLKANAGIAGAVAVAGFALGYLLGHILKH